MGAEFNKIDSDLIRIDEQTDLKQLKKEIGNKNPKLYETIKKWQKIEIEKKNNKEKVLYITKTMLEATKVDFNIERLERNITDTYEFFQGTQLEKNLENTENLQNVAEMIDDFSENILFTGDKPIITYNFDIKTRKNLITGMSLKISELVGNNKRIGDEIAEISNGSLLSIAGTTISAYFNKTFTDNIEQYRKSLEGLNNVPSSNFNKPENVKSIIDQLIENKGNFDKSKLKEVEISDIKKIGNLLGTNLVKGELAKNISAAAEINSNNSDLSGEQKMKLFFNSSMGKKIKEFFNENPLFSSIISFLLSTFMGIDLEKLMGNDKITKEEIPEFRRNILENSSDIKNVDKLFLTSDGEGDLSVINRLYGIKELLKYSDDKDLKDVFFDIQNKAEFIKIREKLAGNVIDSNGTITDNMDETINLYYDFLSQKSSEKPLSIDEFIKSKKEENQSEILPTKDETDDWKEKSPEKKGDYIIGIFKIGKYKYETKINKNGTVTIRSNVPELIKYIPEDNTTGEILTTMWNNPELEKLLQNESKIKEIIGETLKGDKSGKFNNQNKITLYFDEKKEVPFTFVKSNINKVESKTSDTKKIIAGTAGAAVASNLDKIEPKTESPKINKEPIITQKPIEKIIEEDANKNIKEEKVEKMTESEMNKKVPDMSKDIDINKTNFTLKYDENHTIRVNKDNSIFVKIKGKNDKYELLEFKNSKTKDLINKIYAGSLIYSSSLEENVTIPLKKALKTIINQINNSSIDLGKSEDGKEDYGELTLQKKYSTEVKTIEESRKELVKDKKENPEKVKEKKKEQEKNNIAYENKKDGITFIRYQNIIGNKMHGKLGDKDFSINLKKISGKNPVIFVKLGKAKYQSEIVKDKETFSWNNLFYKISSDKYQLKFNGDSNISVDSDADVVGNIDGGDFNIDPENLIREINNNISNQTILWDNSPTPGTKMVFKKYN